MKADSVESKINIVGIKKKYGKKEVLKDVNLTIPFSS